jgi:hypothetical protein
MSVGPTTADESDEAMTMKIAHMGILDLPYLSKWQVVWWLLTRPFYIHPRAPVHIAEDEDPHVTAIIELMRDFPGRWTFNKHTADYEGEPGDIPFKIWTANGKDKVKFYEDEEPEFTDHGKARIWKALKGLKALHVYHELERARAEADEEGLEERVKEKSRLRAAGIE